MLINKYVNIERHDVNYTKIKLGLRNIQYNDVINIVSELQNNDVITSINLSDNPNISSTGYSILLNNGLSNNISVQQLYCKQSDKSLQSIGVFCYVLQNNITILNTIDLSNNESMGIPGVVLLLNSLQTNTTITNIILKSIEQ